jgi:hypothetical protein
MFRDNFMAFIADYHAYPCRAGIAPGAAIGIYR